MRNCDTSHLYDVQHCHQCGRTQTSPAETGNGKTLMIAATVHYPLTMTVAAFATPVGDYALIARSDSFVFLSGSRPRQPWTKPCVIPRRERAHIRACMTSAQPQPLPDAAAYMPPPQPRVLFCDVDGTLLDTAHAIPQRNVDTIMLMMDSTNVLFVPATGKSRAGAVASMDKLGQRMKKQYPNGLPGVYLNGLVVYGLDGNLVYSNTLDKAVCLEIVALAKKFGLSLVAYTGDGDTILFDGEKDEYISELAKYHEPEPVLGLDGGRCSTPIYKFLFMSKEERIVSSRVDIEAALGNSLVEITRATEGMLEVLPFGASKGAGVAIFLETLGIGWEEAMAIGDGENDVEMLNMVGTSVSMENGVSVAKEAAQFSTACNNSGGAADAIERFVLSM
jgi:Cof subfamily protein (haloacid dehalogenase superfamily)